MLKLVKFGDGHYGCAQREALMRDLARAGWTVIIKVHPRPVLEWNCLLVNTVPETTSAMAKGESLWDCLSKACVDAEKE